MRENGKKKKFKKAGLLLAGALTVMSLSGCVCLDPGMTVDSRVHVSVDYDKPVFHGRPSRPKPQHRPSKPRPVYVHKPSVDWSFRIDWQNY